MRLPFIFIIVLFILAIMVDSYLWYAINRYTSRRNRKKWCIADIIIMAIGYILLIVVASVPVRDEGSDILPCIWLLYSFLTLYIPRFIIAICILLGALFKSIFGTRRREFRTEDSREKNAGIGIGLFLGVLTFVVLWWGVFSTRRNIEVNTVNIASERVPAAFNGYKIVQFSDMHVGTWGEDTTFVSEAVDRINSLNPDIIVFTGDIVNRRTEELKPFLKVLGRLHARNGVYSVLGNHDYGDYIDWKDEAAHKANNELLAKWQKQMGWRLLNNDFVILRKGDAEIVLIGVENWGEPPFPEYGRLADAYAPAGKSGYNLKDSRYKILLTHNPEHWTREVKDISNIDLSLSGHTHAMQMMFRAGDWKWSPSVFKYPKWGGLYTETNTDGHPMNIYVNIGSGEVGMPSRLLAAYPEITEIILHHK